MKKKQIKVVMEDLAQQFIELDLERQRIERDARYLRKQLDELKESIQNMVGVAEELDVPFVSRIGKYYITQIKKHRDVDSYSYDFIDFKVVSVQ